MLFCTPKENISGFVSCKKIKNVLWIRAECKEYYDSGSNTVDSDVLAILNRNIKNITVKQALNL